jgi:hypothetical protein
VKKSTGDILGVITISAGVTQYDLNETAAEFVRRADACLYGANMPDAIASHRRRTRLPYSTTPPRSAAGKKSTARAISFPRRSSQAGSRRTRRSRRLPSGWGY